MGSHSVTCHPTQVNAPRLTPAMQAGTRFTYPGGMEGWVDLVDLIAPGPGVEPATFWSRVRSQTSEPPRQLLRLNSDSNYFVRAKIETRCLRWSRGMSCHEVFKYILYINIIEIFCAVWDLRGLQSSHNDYLKINSDNLSEYRDDDHDVTEDMLTITTSLTQLWQFFTV